MVYLICKLIRIPERYTRERRGQEIFNEKSKKHFSELEIWIFQFKGLSNNEQCEWQRDPFLDNVL